MKLPDPPPNLRRFAGVLATVFAAGAPVTAAPFLYSPTDLLLLFRQVGNASDLVVNLGSITQYDGLPAGTRLPVSQLTPEHLTATFPNLNGLLWSAAAANRPPANPAFPLQTLWVTAPRTDPGTPSTPWLRKGSFLQGNAGSQIDGIGVNAALTSSLIPGGPDNTATRVVLPVNSNFPIAPLLGPDGNYVGAFQGKVEALTPEDFDANPTAIARTDLYELLPGTSAAGTLNQPGRYLGTFELTATGSVTFVVAASAPPAPTITGLTRVGDLTTVSFTTATGFTYRLRRSGPDGLAGPLTGWNSVGTAAGTGATVALQDNAPGGPGFYVIAVSP